ncbi:MAG: hypothetical protein A2487_07420 [Candidatus Raymondbacteria bacterium RifOxyC12_full_50_8]|uniref:histidine kinase n=1 Tax=Candidatus Raymondbacteria bacterium RIFOXYD12_FULL_49_13 TaxID=1817890 RepID=A0A1F7F9E0_UNCRA|nr:MAG: hypothetical protein A2350_06835 [Candidatus Raymondbacteria bacterium RifOxyB12_full_50_8]OGJ93211.1 MAG: hypothetical protein A2248_17725 [Candidatus Raymondbacteria bacterium RIFOXYA2_FULL_49_16]OGJ99430.1 MAG: hypothetical protein A2487_07420 [Candidatus Raymondbacteria bacterium RifOxyC12_full_50_8]OGK03294.1 MAG: hypothetical protein A2519_15070 [Candidatus Raymondbacteria bacterium RIFOXYD12_FULL_49_13]OGP44933.1 MAG: hypothetical protein A2324_19650 [Candidatus Raymondbacteria b
MKNRSLRTNILFSFLAVIAILGLFKVFMGYYVINHYVVESAQTQVKNTLSTARSVLNGEIESIDRAFALVSVAGNIGEIKEIIGLDYLYVTGQDKFDSVQSEIVREAIKGNATGGLRIIGEAELISMNHALFDQSRITLKKTPRARPTADTILTRAMAIEYAKPFFNSAGRVDHVLYGGRIINRYFGLVDRIHDIVYEDKTYQSKPLGTVTIFLNDIRIATNVLTREGDRAVGTRVSEVVYRNVVEQGKTWIDRAFVVTDWYLTSYEPLRDIRGAIIGMLYVGVLEKPYTDMRRNYFFIVLCIIAGATLLATILSIILSRAVSRPLIDLVTATEQLSQGKLGWRTSGATRVREVTRLLSAFDTMAQRLKERDDSLHVTNEKLETLNKSYLDLIGMVAHELKGILASTVLNAYSLRDGFLGMLNFKQKKALNSIARNLDYFDATVKNFLNLSRIEKAELSLFPAEVKLKNDIIDAAVDAFGRQAYDKGMIIDNSVDPGLVLTADASLLQIVVNNLVLNAIKYGIKDGRIAISSRDLGGMAEVTVYNDGRPLTGDDKERLFKRFSRLAATPEGRKVHGTGIGLFITKEIVEKHGGAIRVEAGEKGNSFIFTVKKNIQA